MLWGEKIEFEGKSLWIVSEGWGICSTRLALCMGSECYWLFTTHIFCPFYMMEVRIGPPALPAWCTVSCSCLFAAKSLFMLQNRTYYNPDSSWAELFLLYCSNLALFFQYRYLSPRKSFRLMSLPRNRKSQRRWWRLSKQRNDTSSHKTFSSFLMTLKMTWMLTFVWYANRLVLCVGSLVTRWRSDEASERSSRDWASGSKTT